MMFGWWNGTGWGLFWMVVSMLVFWGALAAIVAAVVRSSGGRRSDERDADADELLRRRFAEGLITEQEYRDRLRVLSGTGR